ncbi:MAG: RICIN domain-containing protein, partial [Acutalibacteraceae bacterium]
SDDKNGEYSEGDTVELSVVLEEGYVFNGWYLVVDGERAGEALSTEETFTYTVGTENVTIQAYVTAEGEDPVDPTPTESFNKITDISEVTAGSYVITAIYSTENAEYAFTGEEKMKPTAATVSNDKVVAPTDTMIWEFEDATDGNFYIKNKATGKYLGGTTGTGTVYDDTATEPFAVTLNSDGSFRIACTVASTRILAMYNNTEGRWYTSVGSYNVKLSFYKLGEEKPEPVTYTTVYFTKPTTWGDTIRVWAWNTEKNNAESFDVAPEMTFVETNDYGQKVYSYELSSEYVNVIFHDGTNKTATIAVADIFADGNNGVYLDGTTVCYYKYAVEAPKYTVTVTTNDEAAAIVSDDKNGEYSEGDTVELSVVLEEGYVFNGWYLVVDGERAGEALSTEETFTYTVGTENVTIQAYVTAEGEDPDVPVDPTPTENFVKISDINDVTAGSYIITATSDSIEYAFTGEAKMKPAAPTVSNGKVVAPTDSMVWEFEDATDGNFYIKNKATGKYLGGATGTGTVYDDTATEPFAVTLNSDGSFRISCTSASTRILAMYNTTEGRWYTSAGSYNVQLTFYKLGAEAVVTTSTVYFTKPASWGDTIRVWAWNTEKNNAESFDVAPEMTFVETNDYGQKVYSYELSSEYVNVIFHDGTNKTATIAVADIFADGNNGVYLDGTTVCYYKYAVEAPKYTVTVTTNDEAAAIVSDDKNGEYSEGDTVELSVILEEGYVFNGWYLVVDGERAGEALSTEETFTYTVGTENVTIQAYVTAEGENPDVPVDEAFIKISGADSLSAGSFIITAINDTTEYAFTGGAKMVPTTDFTVTNDTIATAEATDTMTWIFEATDGGYYIKNKATGKYIGWTSSTTVAWDDTATQVFTITANDDGTYTLALAINGRKLGLYTSNNAEARLYSTVGSNIVNLNLYKLGEQSSEPTTTTTVYFTKPASWGDTIRIWAWNTDKNIAEDFANAPVMTFVETNSYGQKVYSYELSSEYTNVIFHDGTNQTETIAVADIFADGNNGVYLDGTTVCYYKYAVEAPKYTILVGSDNENCLVDEDVMGEYEEGEKVTLTVLEYEGYEFLGWYIGSTKLSAQTTYEYTVGTTDVEIVAKFREITTQTYTVIVDSDTASCTIDDVSGDYADGTKITLSVIKYDGYNFLGWYVNNECVSTDTTYEYTVTEDAEIVAKFEAIEVVEKYIVTVESDTTGCTVADVDGEYEAGTKITLSVTKYDGYKFLGWYIGSTKLSDSTTYEYTVTGYAEIVAKFEALIYVALDVDDASHGTIVGSDELYVEKNTPFTISASALAGYVFAAWTVDGVQVSTSATYTVSDGVTSAVNYTATFKMLGDFDGNFSITIAEVTKLLDSLSGKAALTASESAVADFNSDGNSNLLDAYLMYIKTRA